MAVDSLSLQYYEYILKPWLATWKEGEKPQVMTEKEINQEEEEIRASIATVEAQQERQSKINASRLPREIKSFKKHPMQGVTFIKSDAGSLTILVEGPKNTPYEGANFDFYITFGEEYPFKPPAVSCLQKIYHPQVSKQGQL